MRIQIPPEIVDANIEAISMINNLENIGIVMIAFHYGHPPTLVSNVADLNEVYKFLQWLLDNKDDTDVEYTKLSSADES